MEIKGWFSDWKEVDISKAVEFYRHIFKTTPKKYRESQFPLHFRGIGWETIEKLSGFGRR